MLRERRYTKRKTMKLLFLISVLAIPFFSKAGDGNENDIKAIAEEFIKVVDNNDADALAKILHPEMIQFVRLDGNIIPFKAADYIKMVGDKKLGGVPRKVTHKYAEVLRGESADVVITAKSSEYDFLYQLSMMKGEHGWVIVGILADIEKA